MAREKRSALREFVRAALPKQMLQWLKRQREYAADRRLYGRYAGPDDRDAHIAMTQHNIEMQLTKDYHRIEKGLTLPTPKNPFGADVERRVNMLLPLAEAAAEPAPYVSYARSAAEALRRWNSSATIDDAVAPKRPTLTNESAGIEHIMKSRHSVRNFAPRPVPRQIIEAAATLAIRSPSVCNRQPWKMRVFDAPADIESALRYQNGNVGFRHTVPALALITVERGLFAGANERNQPFIEGGLFAMSLVWALHGLGLDSCMLNMSQSSARLRHMRAALGVPESEAVIMFIAIGYGESGHRVARSPRRPLRDVLEWQSR